MIGEDALLEGFSKFVNSKEADGVLISAHSRSQGILRFSQDNVRQNIATEDVRIYIKVLLGKKVGVAMTSSIQKEGLRKAFENALAIAKLSRPDPICCNFIVKEPERKQVKTYYEETANLPVEKKMTTVKELQAGIRKAGLSLAGSLLIGEEELCVVNSAGLARYQPFSIGAVKLIAISGGSSGFAAALAQDVSKIDFPVILDTAIKKCEDGKSVRDVEVENADVLLEPEAVSEILDWMGYIGFCAKSFLEKRSFLSGRIGEKLMNQRVSIYDDGLDPEMLMTPFDFEGTTKKKVALIEKGVAKDFVCDARYAKLYDRDSTGHALSPDDPEGPMPLNLIMEQGTHSIEEMLKSMERGILITRFHYVNGLLDTRRALMTGLTRDGTFLIEDGRCVSGLKNLRFTQGMLDAFSNIAMVSRERKLVGDPADSPGATLAPAVLIRNFTFTGRTP